MMTYTDLNEGLDELIARYKQIMAENIVLKERTMQLSVKNQQAEVHIKQIISRLKLIENQK